MYVGKETGNDHSESVSCYGPCGVFTAGAAAKVLSCHQYAATIGRVVQYETFDRIPLFVVAPVAEQVVAKSAFVGCLQKTGRNNLVGVHILQRKWHAGAGNYIEF